MTQLMRYYRTIVTVVLIVLVLIVKHPLHYRPIILQAYFDQPSIKSNVYAAIRNLATSYQFHQNPDPSNVSDPYLTLHCSLWNIQSVYIMQYTV